MPTVDPVLGHVAAGCVGAQFLIAAWSKLSEPEIFRDAVENYRILPLAAAGPFAVALPWLEALAGALLLWQPARPLAALLALALLATVTAAIVINLARGRDRIDCGCGGDLHTPLSRALVVRNAVLMLLVAVAAAPVGVRPMAWLDVVAAVFATLFGIGLYFLANMTISHQSRLQDLRNSP